MGYLDETGLSRLWNNIKTYIQSNYLTTETEPAFNGSVASTLTSNNIVKGTSQSYNIWSGTQAEYDAIATKDNNTLYFIKES